MNPRKGAQYYDISFTNVPPMKKKVAFFNQSAVCASSACATKANIGAPCVYLPQATVVTEW
jgi:hypothetical protein